MRNFVLCCEVFNQSGFHSSFAPSSLESSSAAMSTAFKLVLFVTLLGVSTALDVLATANASAVAPILGEAYYEGTAPSSTNGAADHRRLESEVYTFQTDLLNAVNRERATHGLPRLCTNFKLQNAAQRHANDMASRNFMGHTGTNGSNPPQRIKAEGYAMSTCGENVAAGQVTAVAVMKAWMASTLHRENILRRQFTMFGCGYSYSASSTHKHYWAQDFGSSTTERCS